MTASPKDILDILYKLRPYRSGADALIQTYTSSGYDIQTISTQLSIIEKEMHTIDAGIQQQQKKEYLEKLHKDIIEQQQKDSQDADILLQTYLQ